MDEILDLILYENENSRLDFKREEYKKENYFAFLKDVISMANANPNQDSYIILGLKPVDSEDRGFVGIPGQLTDAATYQQLVQENVEPEINIDYFPLKHEGYTFGVFKISNCIDPPYLMKKDFGKLYKGDGFIRRGSSQGRLLRRDFDRYFESKLARSYFSGEVEFTITNKYGENKIVLIDSDKIVRPSMIKKEKILDKKKQEKQSFSMLGVPYFDTSAMIVLSTWHLGGGAIPYENRDIETLEENLKSVGKTYYEEDCYEIFEKNSNMVNISLFNSGDVYIEDATLVLKIPKITGIYVVDRIFENPDSTSGPKTMESLQYPEVKVEGDFYVIKGSIGNVKHKLNQDAFSSKVRLFATTKVNVETFTAEVELFAKNLKTSIKKEILVRAELVDEGAA